MNAAAEHIAGQILLDVSAEDYQRRELGVATSGVLSRLRTQTLAHHKAWAESPDDNETPAKVFGKAYHCRVLEPERFAATYITGPIDPPNRPSRRQREAKKQGPSTIAAIEFWDAWDSENAGRLVLPAEDFERIEAMYAALLKHDVAAGIMREGQSEVTLRWVDEGTGVRCKARADWWKPGQFFMDLKTTDDASPDAFKRSIENYGYHIQHAHYCEGARACGEPVRNYLILAQEKEAPYLPAVYHIDAAAEVRGYELRARGLERLSRAIAANKWPGYTGINEISLPAWALKD